MEVLPSVDQPLCRFKTQGVTGSDVVAEVSPSAEAWMMRRTAPLVEAGETNEEPIFSLNDGAVGFPPACVVVCKGSGPPPVRGGQ